MDIDGLPVYKITLDKEYSEGNDLGVDMIAFTDSPAIMVKGMAFNSSKPKPQAFKDDTKMRIAAPAMIPMDIYRSDEDGEYYVQFTEQEIERIHAKFMLNLNNKNLFNLEHDADKKVPAYILECWLVENPKEDRSYSTFNCEVPKGTLFVVAQITDKDYYNALVESGRTAFSVEGFLGLKLSEIKQKQKQSNMETPRFELDGKFYDLIDGKPVLVMDEKEDTEKVELSEDVKVELAEDDKKEDEEKVEKVEAAEDEKEDEEKEELMEEKEEEKEEEKVEAADEGETENEEDKIISIVTPLLDEFKKDILQIIGEMQNENEENVEVELKETKLSSKDLFKLFVQSQKN